MFDGIRSAMRTPLARPPGRRGWVRRFAPEWGALSVYLFMLAVFLWNRIPHSLYEPGHAALVGAIWAYALAGLIFIVGPLVSGALAWARERDRDTLETLVLTPAGREAVVRGRFWAIALPWLRFCVYLLPIYLLLSTNGFFEMAHDGKPWIASDACALGSHGFFALCGGVRRYFVEGPMRLHAWSVTLALLRSVNDLSVPLFACALAFCISLRSRTAGSALLWSCLLVPGTLFTVLDLHDWGLLLVVWKVVPISGYGPGYVLVCSGYLVLGLAAFIARIWLALWLVRLAARNFDWYALGEKPPADRPGPA